MKRRPSTDYSPDTDSSSSPSAESEDDNDIPAKPKRNDNKIRNLRKLQRSHNDPFDMPDDEFRDMFRLTRSAAEDLIEEMLKANPALQLRKISTAIPFKIRFLSILNFLRNGTYQKQTSENRWFCQSQSTMSHSLRIVLDEMMKLKDKYIRFPSTPDEVAAAKADFKQQLGVSSVVCAVTGNHIAIIRPAERENGYLYYNTQEFYSINALTACDANMKFLFADARYPGSVHDSAIWKSSQLRRLVVEDGATFMLGNNVGFTSKLLLTPFGEARPGSKEEQYNKTYTHACNVIERAFVSLKRRFRCLMPDSNVLHYTPANAARILYACMMLHNICLDAGIEMTDEKYDIVGAGAEAAGMADDGVAITSSNKRKLVNSYIERCDEIQDGLVQTPERIINASSMPLAGVHNIMMRSLEGSKQDREYNDLLRERDDLLRKMHTSTQSFRARLQAQEDEMVANKHKMLAHRQEVVANQQEVLDIKRRKIAIQESSEMENTLWEN